VAVKKICEIRKTLSCCLAYPSARFTRKKPLYPLFSSSWQARQIRPTRQPERFQTRFSGVSHSARADGVLNPAEHSIREEILSERVSWPISAVGAPMPDSFEIGPKFYCHGSLAPTKFPILFSHQEILWLLLHYYVDVVSVNPLGIGPIATRSLQRRRPDPVQLRQNTL
jgi:hypothetical protein